MVNLQVGHRTAQLTPRGIIRQKSDYRLQGKLVDNAVTPTNGQVLAFSTTTGKWEPTTGASGGGTITGVTPGTDLTGGGTSGNVTLNLNTALTDARYAQLSANNTFTGNQSVTGALTATGSVTAPLFNGNAGAIEGKVVSAARPRTVRC